MVVPSEAFTKIHKTLRFVGSLVGCDIFRPNYGVSIMTILTGCVIITYCIFSIVTIFKLYHEDWMIILEASCLIASAIQGAVKLVSVIANMHKIRVVHDIIWNIYVEYEKRGQKYVTVMNETCSRLTKLLKVIFFTYMFSGAGMILTAATLMVITGRRIPIIKVYFPFLDLSTFSGFYTTFAVHSFFMFVGVFGLFASDMLAIIFLMQSFLFSDIFKLKVEELNEALADPQRRIHTDNITDQLKDIIKWHQTYSQFTESCNDIFYYVVTTMVATAGIQILICLFLALVGDWPGAYTYSLLGFYALYVYCILGTKIEICNDEFCSEMYNISWYDLTTSQQKVVGLMLNKSQRPETMYVAGVYPLSVSTALQITKTVYSIFTMMLQFVADK